MINLVVPMLSIVVPIVLVVAYIYLNPIEINCMACETGGFFYKCAKGTGVGTKTCDDFKKGQQFLDEVDKEIQETMKKVNKIRDEIMEPIIKTQQAIEKIASDAANAIPPLEIKKLKINMDSCGIPGGPDPCKDMEKAMNTTLDGLNKALDAVENALNKVTGAMNGAITTILKPLQEKLDNIYKTVVNPWMDVKDDVVGLIDDVNQLLASVSALGIGNVIVAYIAGQIQAVFPFVSVTIAIAVAVILVLAWVIGGFFGSFMLVSTFGSTIISSTMMPFRLLVSLVG